MRRYRRPFLYVSITLALALSAAGCKQSSSPDTTNTSNGQDAQQYPAQDPASANLAPISNATDNTGAPDGAYQTPQAQQQLASSSNQQDPYAAPYSSDSNYDQDYDSYDTPVEYAPEPPPELPEYQQPPCPGDNYIWTPGYWNYEASQGYYWVPGVWVVAPYAGALWTPGWWGFNNGRYGWHRGFWGRHVGYYGGINYGYGYSGYGYQGGYWHGNQFAYNRVVNNVNTNVVHNVYNYRFQTQNSTRVSYNGGRGGVTVRPRPAEVAALHEQHSGPMSTQMQHAQQARSNQQNFARVNHGRPAEPVASRPLQADNNVHAPELRNPGAIAPARERPGQAHNVPAPQAGHPVGNVQPQQGGPHVGQQGRTLQPGERGNPNAPAQGNRQPQGSNTPERGRVPAHAVGPEPAVPRQRQESSQPRQAQPSRQPAPQRTAPERTPAPQRSTEPRTERPQQNRGAAPSRPESHPPAQGRPQRPEEKRPQ